VILVGERMKGMKLRENGWLCDVAPTMIDVLGISPSAEMTGRSLLEK
jgi:2,3-bisphosphoglycerate-independent phosphoglycerate mutase